MTTFEQCQVLMRLLTDQPGLRLPELEARFKISSGTIRNGRIVLDKAGLVVREKGGAALQNIDQTQNPSYKTQLRKNHAAKEAIAARFARRRFDCLFS